MIHTLLRLALMLALALVTGWAFYHWLDPAALVSFLDQRVMCN